MQPGLSAGWIPLPDSGHKTPPGAKWLGPVDPTEPIEFVFHLRPRTNAEASEPDGFNRADDGDQDWERTMGEIRGADPVDLDKIQEFARQIGFSVVDVNGPGRSVAICGTAADISSIFRVELAYYRFAGEVRRGQIGPIYLPRSIAHVVEEVSGLAD